MNTVKRDPVWLESAKNGVIMLGDWLDIRENNRVVFLLTGKQDLPLLVRL